MITICLIYFKSLTLKNLDAALYSIRQQDLSNVRDIVLVDNDTDDNPNDIAKVVSRHLFPIHVNLYSYKHGVSTRTHSWSSNIAISKVYSPWVFFTRADYVLDFDIVKKFSLVAAEYREHWPGFITSNGCHLSDDIAACERQPWREQGTTVLRNLHGVQFDYTIIDAGVWMAQRASVVFVGGLDESLSAWGHAQTEFQARLHKSGVEFVRVPEVLFWHPMHGGQRDIALANEQLGALGVDVKELWDRWEGTNPYR